MDLTVNLQPEARLDIDHAAEWCEDARPGLGQSFLLEVDHAIQMIIESPRTWPIYKADIRYYVFRRFPFILFYRIIDESLWVITVAHQKREPGFWEHR